MLMVVVGTRVDLIGERRPHVHGGGEQRKRTGGREEEGPLAGLQPTSILARIPSPPTSMRPVATGFPVHPSRQSSSLLAFTASSAVQSSASEERRPTPAAWDAILGHAMCGPQLRFVGRLCVARTNQQGDEDYPGSTLFCLLCCVQFAACCTVGDCLAVHISSLCSLQTTYVRWYKGQREKLQRWT
ncbi:uncharacterized protein LOC119320030 isoform X3 [Triticum dicoccoides]|uniref:uncharacterized protein LOC119320030 isoform X3 n=1 Tax=Triticum dicoccoides TaxID=85692 RepID=UPI0018914FB0|nr:uncharacterized protein LOC119320030 isoform X3 [Triticum dicoccoides]XP_044411513.1 uncharacterized protein LOC123136243 isoform X2 [Triticum aestivum]